MDALNGEYPQVAKYVSKCDENIERQSIEYVQRWIRSLHVIKGRSEKYKKTTWEDFLGHNSRNDWTKGKVDITSCTFTYLK